MSEALHEEFSEENEQALACVLDTLIPPSPDGRLPAAGALGLVSDVAAAMVAQPALRPAITMGLAAFREVIGSSGPEGFAALSIAERSAILNDLAPAQPAFLPGLLFTVYGAYYRHPTVVKILGIEAWPPHPKGYEMAEIDESLLDEVRNRAPLYRTP